MTFCIRPAVFFLTLVGFTLAVRAQQSDIASAPVALAPESFPIFPWDILPNTRAAYDEAKECGFNIAGFVHPADLDTVAAAGMKCFVSDPSIAPRDATVSDADMEARVKAMAERTASHAAVFGYHVIDEPRAGDVPRIAKWANAFQAAAPNAIAYTNLLPSSGFRANENLEATYTAYLDSYLAAVHPKAFSFDHYAMMDDGSVRPAYFQSLELIRRASIKNNVPFWNVCLACAHFRYADPSPATLRFQVFTSLAYGARGIGWFTYTGRDRGNYRLSAIDLMGRRTATWDMLRDANDIIHHLAPAYVPMKSVGVFHHPSVPAGCQAISDSQFVSELKGAGPFIVGEFTDPAGHPAVLIVNRDLQHSTTWSITPKVKSDIQRVSSYTGKTRPLGAEDNWLAPGGGILLVLTPKPTTQP